MARGRYECNRHIISHLLEGTPLANTARAFLRNIVIEEAIYRSHEQKRQIDVPLRRPATVEATLAVAGDDGVRAELGEGAMSGCHQTHGMMRIIDPDLDLAS
jgi:hypothetical protein